MTDLSSFYFKVIKNCHARKKTRQLKALKDSKLAHIPLSITGGIPVSGYTHRPEDHSYCRRQSGSENL